MKDKQLDLLKQDLLEKQMGEFVFYLESMGHTNINRDDISINETKSYIIFTYNDIVLQKLKIDIRNKIK